MKSLIVISMAFTFFSGAVFADPVRYVEGVVKITDSGESENLLFEVPSDTRSVTVVAEGLPDSLYATSFLSFADGIDRINFDSQDKAATMRDLYFREEISYAPSSFAQSMRLGTHILTYPYAATQKLEAGAAELRIFSTSATNETVKVKIFMPKDDGAETLHINLISLSPRFNLRSTKTMVDAAGTLLGQAGIKLKIHDKIHLPNTRFRKLTDFNEPQETPSAQAAQLAEFVGKTVENDAVNVFFVEELSAAGISLGIPGTPVPGHYYFGVVIKYSSFASSMGHTLAHELGHFLGLHHVTNRARSGRIYYDPFSDTTGQSNLMAQGSVLSPEQIFAMRKSPLLK